MDADAIFEGLVRARRTMSFRANADDGGGAREPAEDRDRGIPTQISPEILQRRLLQLQRDAKSLQEEQGIDVLYFAVGFLRWFEDRNSDVPREAPLVLLPAALHRDDAHSAFRLSIRDDDLDTNICLQEMLKEHGIALPDIEDHDDWRPSDYFNKVRLAIRSQERWSVDPNGAVLGFFSFSKHLMHRDLKPESWPGESLLLNRHLAGLYLSGFADDPGLIPENARPDDIIDTADLPYILDADASQALVIENARKGHDLVVQGPPGTGKSQTIANVIAAAVRDGKTVLFVAEKLAALTVVHDRLAKAGLEDVCFELHSRKANKKAVIAALEHALDATACATPGRTVIERLREVRDQLNAATSDLHTKLLESGISPFQALAEQVALRAAGYPAPALSLPESASWSPQDWQRIRGLVSNFAELVKRAGATESHPWRGVAGEALQPADQERLQHSVSNLCLITDEIGAQLSELSDLLGFSPDQPIGRIPAIADMAQSIADRPRAPPSLWEAVATTEQLERLIQIAGLGLDLNTAREPIEACFIASAMERDAESLRTPLVVGNNSLFARFRKDYRRASRELGGLLKAPLPKAAKQRVELLDSLIRVRKLAAELAAEATYAAGILKDEWRGDRTDFALLREATRWLAGVQVPEGSSKQLIGEAPGTAEHWHAVAQGLRSRASQLMELFASIARALRLDLSLAFGAETIDAIRIAALRERANTWLTESERLDEWLRLRNAASAVRAIGLGLLCDRLGQAGTDPASADAELRYARAEAIWKSAITARPRLATLPGSERGDLVHRFRDLDQRMRAGATAEILASYHAAKPTGTMGDMAVIRGEIARKRGHLPIRKLLEKAGATVQRIKPVFLMSPLSVAQFLPPGRIEFDLLIIDEASQVKPEDALGAIVRAKQIVVVGDKQQLPPTSFFERLVSPDDSIEAADEDEAPLSSAAPLTDMDSVLSLCEARNMASRMLRWHYRSRHPSLIEVSNAEFYDNKLFMPPSPSLERNSEGLTVTRVAGSYDRGGKRTNQIEAETIVAAVRTHAHAFPEISLGVVAFSVAQKALLDDLMEAARRDDPTLDAFVHRPHAEEFFIKNLENVQGDERDAIFISIGYGPRIAGARLDSMGFGPVSSEGGERRLNVLFTRARRQTRVFVSFGSDDIDLARTTQGGPRVLKRFLRYAETGIIDQPLPTGQDFDSPFEETVARAIEEMGFQADPQVGSAGFRIDLAVRDPDRPGRYLLAVECDGAAYHSARWARERDRLRQEVLEGLGWSFHRIWSTDWFRTPAMARHKLHQAIELARTEAARPAEPKIVAPEASTQPARQSTATPAPQPPAVPPYIEASFDLRTTAEPHEIPLPELSGTVVAIIRFEGPIHEDEIARRLARLSGKERTGSRIMARVRQALQQAAATRSIRCDGPFWSPADADWRPTVRDRSAAALSLQRPDRIADSEIELAIATALDSNGGLPVGDIPVAVARLFGFHRTGAEARRRIESVLAPMLASSRAVVVNGHVRLA